MNLKCSKIKTYLNFAKKSNNLIFGLDDILKSKKKIYLILMSNLLGNSSKNKLENFISKNNIDLFKLEQSELNELLENKFIKIVAVTDINLSDAIKKYMINE